MKTDSQDVRHPQNPIAIYGDGATWENPSTKIREAALRQAGHREAFWKTNEGDAAVEETLGSGQNAEENTTQKRTKWGRKKDQNVKWQLGSPRTRNRPT